MLIGDNCLFAMSFQHVELLVLQKAGLEQKVLAEGPGPVEGMEQECRRASSVGGMEQGCRGASSDGGMEQECRGASSNGGLEQDCRGTSSNGGLE